MTKSEADKLTKRKNDAPGHKQSLDGWIYRATAASGVPGGHKVERRKKDGFGWSTFRTAAN
jgi:hypothetical protein